MDEGKDIEYIQACPIINWEIDNFHKDHFFKEEMHLMRILIKSRGLEMNQKLKVLAASLHDCFQNPTLGNSQLLMTPVPGNWHTFPGSEGTRTHEVQISLTVVQIYK